jgi:large subunit ribosomal protein L30
MTAANKKPAAGRAQGAAAGRAQGASDKAGDRPIRATLMKSTIGALPQIKATVESLGFRRMNQTRDLPDNPAVRGMLKAVNFLVAVEGTPYIRPKRSQYKIWRSRSNKKHQRGK